MKYELKAASLNMANCRFASLLDAQSHELRMAWMQRREEEVWKAIEETGLIKEEVTADMIQRCATYQCWPDGWETYTWDREPLLSFSPPKITWSDDTLTLRQYYCRGLPFAVRAKFQAGFREPELGSYELMDNLSEIDEDELVQLYRVAWKIIELYGESREDELVRLIGTASKIMDAYGEIDEEELVRLHRAAKQRKVAREELNRHITESETEEPDERESNESGT